MTEILLDHEPASGIATITFNRPEAFNALNPALAAEFEGVAIRLSRDAGLRCLVLRGAGPAFLAGGDVKAFADDPGKADLILQRILRHMHPAILAMRRMDAPVLAAVNGVAAGAGLSLVLGADYAIARRSAKLVLAYDKLGTAPDCGGSWFLKRKVGRAKAFELMLTGRTLSADAAAEAGILNQVVADENFDAEVADLTARIAAGPTRAFGSFKRLLDQDLPLEAQLEMEKSHFMSATYTEDFRSAACAFVAKQSPKFSGR